MILAISTVFVVWGLVAPAPPSQPAATQAASTEEAPVSTAPSEGNAPAPAAGATDPNTGDAAPTSDKVTRYSFTGLDIDGELRTPALLQFLARIAGEFETLGIPHRSFMPELRATVGEDAL